jgi:hypothetical protein
MPQEELSQDICFQIANLKFRAKELNDKEAAERLKNILIERKALPLLQELAKELVSNWMNICILSLMYDSLLYH